MTKTSLTSSQINSLAQKLKSLHFPPSSPLLLANVWDASSTISVLSHPQVKALATASYAVAMMVGVEDAELTLPLNLLGIDFVMRALRKSGKEESVPVSADIQDGYEDVADTIRSLIARGVVGVNLEDADTETFRDMATGMREGLKLRSVEESCERIKTALETAREEGVPDFVINARTDAFGLESGGGLEEVIKRGERYLDAGATTVFVWGVVKHSITEEEVKKMVQAFDGRLAVQPGDIGVKRLRELGVARISVGPKLWRKAIEVVAKEGKEVLES